MVIKPVKKRKLCLFVAYCAMYFHSISYRINLLSNYTNPLFAVSYHTKPLPTKRKPPCIGGMELVSLSCNRVFISAESVGRGWCKIAIATKWYQFHTTDKYGFLFMPWITGQYANTQLRAIFHVQNWNGHPVISMRRSLQNKQVVSGRRPAPC